jgi:REP element-mobilizing transposase RayT
MEECDMPYTGPERQRTRAWWHDYRRPKAYFVTLVCHQQACLWRRIVDGDLLASAGGEMVAAVLAQLPMRYPGTEVGTAVVMPNHLHAVVTLPNPTLASQPSLSDIIGWFKTVTTKRYIRGVRTLGWPPFDGHVWHTSFHDRIIRDECAYAAIVRYVETNPRRWREDQFFEPDTFDPLTPGDGLPQSVRKL